MTTNEQPSGEVRQAGGPSAFSRWVQHRMNARTTRRVRKGRGTFMGGMEVLILHTRGRRTGEARETPVAWFADGDHARLVVASGGGDRHPDWYTNLMGNADRASVELAGRDAVRVRPERLDGPEREEAWQRIAEAQPRIAKYQAKSDREYPVVRLVPA